MKILLWNILGGGGELPRQTEVAAILEWLFNKTSPDILILIEYEPHNSRKYICAKVNDLCQGPKIFENIQKPCSSAPPSTYPERHVFAGLREDSKYKFSHVDVEEKCSLNFEVLLENKPLLSVQAVHGPIGKNIDGQEFLKIRSRFLRNATTMPSIALGDWNISHNDMGKALRRNPEYMPRDLMFPPDNGGSLLFHQLRPDYDTTPGGILSSTTTKFLDDGAFTLMHDGAEKFYDYGFGSKQIKPIKSEIFDTSEFKVGKDQDNISDHFPVFLEFAIATK